MDRYLEARHISRLLTEAGFPTMLAGGCVRDRLLGREPKDYDLATTALPEKCSAFFSDLGFKIVPIGLEHGTISLITPIQSIEITTLRKDVKCHGRTAEVVFSQSFEEDAQRRDFSINALFEDMDGKIRDYTGGLRDLREKRLRFVGEAQQRIREDYLRILRYFRFLAGLGWRPVLSELDAIRANIEGLKRLSAERIHAEIERVFLALNAAEVLPLMDETGTLAVVFPWYHAGGLEDLCRMPRDPSFADPALAWFVFLVRAHEGAWRIHDLTAELQRLRFSRKQRNAITGLTRVFNSRKKPIESWPGLLKIAEAPLIEKEDLLAFFRSALDRGFDWIDPVWIRLLTGMIDRPKPSIPAEPLLRLNPDERGKAMEIVKLYWYLDLCHGKTTMSGILENWKFYGLKLCNKDLARVC